MKITKEMIERSHAVRFSDPCVICGGNFDTCGHDITDTAAVIKQIRALKPDEIKAIMAAG